MTEWVGYLEVDGLRRVVMMTGELVPDGVVEFAFPAERIFRLEVKLAELRGEVVARGETIRFGGQRDEETFVGTCETDSGQGFIELHRVHLLSIGEYRKLSAQYELENGRRVSVFVNADEFIGTPTLFFAERDRFVRLYPSAKGLFSEDGEWLELSTRTEGWVDEDVTIDGPGGKLAGTLMSPPGPGPHPAVVMVHGAAGGLRDYYRAFGEQFVRNGVAALVFDRRGWGESAGDPPSTFADKADDAAAWIEYLRTRPDVEKVGIWGFSNGSWVAPLVAARDPQVAFVCVIGAAGTTALETEIHRRACDLRGQGVPEDQIGWIREMWRMIFAADLSHQPDEDHRRRYDELAPMVAASTELRGITLQEYAIQEPTLGPVPPWASYDELLAELGEPEEAGDLWTCDPVDSYRLIEAPVLFLVGVDDSNLPAIQSAERVGRALEHNRGSIVVLFPNTGHAMNLGRLDAIGMSDEEAGYRLHDYRFASGYLDLIEHWIRTRVTEHTVM
ncbi:alpha/beta hydrolase [Kribbella monticola]|uniref:alpha/beta hydrolase n=1 Tax=Kribbella monticola TaxID=2185285 RepID=UPI000DD3FBA8|nr:alpha/beta hydrolase [Kribbella monticola]